MHPADLYGLALDLYRLTSSDPADPPRPKALVVRLFGRSAIRLDPNRLRVQDALLVKAEVRRDGEMPPGGSFLLYHRRHLSPEALNWAIAHELGEWLLKRANVVDEHIEHLADALAALILAPNQAFLAVYRSEGANLPLLAQVFGTTESCVGMRIGEVLGTPTALLTPSHPQLRLRGDEYGWPPRGELRRCVASGALPPQVRLHRLKDDPRRILLLADAG